MVRRSRQRKLRGGESAFSDVFANIAAGASLAGESGSRYVIFKLQDGESVISDSASLLYLKDGIQKGELKFGDVMSTFGRFLSGETMTLQQYTGAGTVALGGALPGDVMVIPVDPGQTIYLSRGAFIAGTPNVRVSGAFKMLGLLGFGQEEGFVLPSVTVVPVPDPANPDQEVESRGYVWVGSYGTFERHDIAEGQIITVNNGLFLASTTKDYTLAKMGKSLFSSFLGEGLGMEFAGPCVVYTQSKNENDLVAFIAMNLPRSTGSSSSSSPALFSFDFGSSQEESQEGGRKTKVKKVKQVVKKKRSPTHEK
jgi:uncharacterized protein (AIM24 family)